MAARTSQVVHQALFSYSNATTLRASQVVTSVVFTYTDATTLRASQVVLQVLRTLSDYVPPVTHGNSATAKDNSPGQQKKAEEKAAHVARLYRQKLDRRNHEGKSSGESIVFAYPTSHVPPAETFARRIKTRRITRS